MFLRAFIVSIVVLAVSHSAAMAQAESYPKVSGELAVEIQNDWTYESDDRANQNNDLYTTTEPSVSIAFTPSWSLFAHAVLEPVQDPEQFENRVFEDHGAFMEDLFVAYDNGPFSAKAGKFNVGFGIAWDLTPGVYGTDLAEDGYETAERIGGLASWTFASEAVGEHRLSAGSFFLDTSVLSESTPRGRGVTRKEDGGVSNTEDFSSFILSLDGGKLPHMGELAYHLAYMHQGSGESDTADENAFAVGLHTSITIGPEITLTPLVEYVRQQDAGGVAGEDRDFLTLAAQAEWQGFNLALAWTGRETDGTTDQDDHQFQVSVGYAFDFGLTFDAGWKITDEANVQTRTLGAIATYTFEF